MKRISLDQIVSDAQRVRLDPHSSYMISYPHFLAYFARVETITIQEFVLGAMFTYGWMPTQLNFKSRDFEGVLSILNEVKHGCRVGSPELETLQRMINNSLVGPSKLLHFVCPEFYPMWDSNVCAYIGETAVVSNPDHYLFYVDNCQEIGGDPGFEPVWEEISRQCGYQVSACRAVGLVMFENGRGSTSISVLRKAGPATDVG